MKGRRRLIVAATLLHGYVVVFLLFCHWRTIFDVAPPAGVPVESEDSGTEARKPGPASIEVAPLEFRRDERHDWFPNIDSLRGDLGLIRALLHGSPQPRSPQERQHQLLGFVRITKTGSTSLLGFMQRSTQAKHYSKFLHMPNYLSSNYGWTLPSCIYGINDPPEQYAPVARQCAHLAYPHLVSDFAKTLRHLNETAAGPGQAAEPLHVSFTVVCMLREPFERLLSYFHFFREVYPEWAYMHKDAPLVLSALVRGDFPAFVRELSLSSAKLTTRRFQYEYFSLDVDEAIQLVREGRFLPLITECFNASLLLLVQAYPAFFPPDQPRATIEFLESAGSRARRTARGRARLRDGLEPVEAFDMDRLRGQARDEFMVDEYRFFEEAKRAFVRRLQAATNVPNATVDQQIIQRCLGSLEVQPAASYGLHAQVPRVSSSSPSRHAR
jgi:Sulfotransferase family